MAKSKFYALRNMYLVNNEDINYVVSVPNKLGDSVRINWDNIRRFESGEYLGELMSKTNGNWFILHNEEIGMIVVQEAEIFELLT